MMSIGNKLEIALAALLCGAIGGFFSGLTVASPSSPSLASLPPVVLTDRHPLEQVQPYRPDRIIPASGFCAGDEDFCIVTTSPMPAQTLGRLIEALPDKANGPMRSIRLSIISTGDDILLKSPPSSIPPKEPPS